MLEVAMVQSNDPAEVPISIHNRGSRVNVNVPNRRTSARDVCTCPQAVEQRGTVVPSLTGGVHGPPSELARTGRRPPAARSAAALCPSNLSKHLVELDHHARICLCQRHLDRSMQSGSLIVFGQRAPLEQEFIDRYQVDAVPLFQPQGCRGRIKDDQPTIMNARGEDMHDRKPNRCSSAHLQSLSPCESASIRTRGATLSRLALVWRLRSRRRRDALFRALARMPDSVGDQRRHGEHLAVVVVWSACGTGPRTSRGG